MRALLELTDPRKRVIIPYDYQTLAEARPVHRMLRKHTWGGKVGMELCTAEGPPACVRAMRSGGGQCFLDLKFHDIPATVAGAVRSAAKQGVEMLNVHALGGLAMIRAAREAADEFPDGQINERPIILAVTILTSNDWHDLRRLGMVPNRKDPTPAQMQKDVENAVMGLVGLAVEAGMDGVICSAQEVLRIKRAYPDLLVVTPGIRPAWSVPNDQARPVTPYDAIMAGSDLLVIGRPITAPPVDVLAQVMGCYDRKLTPLDALNTIGDEIGRALEELAA